MNNKIEILKNDFLEYLKNYGYSKKTIANYEWGLGHLIDFLENSQLNCLDSNKSNLYLKQVELRYNSGEISRNLFLLLKRVCRLFKEFSETNAIDFKPPKDKDLSPYYSNIINLILSNPFWNASRQSSCRYYSRPFFKWLMSNGYRELTDIDGAVIKKYFIDCTNRMNNRGLSSTRFYLKLLLNYLYENGVIHDNFESEFNFPIPIEQNYHRPTPQSEIALVLEIIDRTSPVGKRNYAMIMTALKTGLRQCDVINLKLSDIDWKAGILNVSQSKTGVALALPLTKDYGEAIIDYLLNARKDSSSDYIFLSSLPPFSKLSRKAIYFHFNEYRKKCGLPNCSFHGLRRMLGSRMVAEGVGIDLVPDILGHSNLDSTRPYIYANASKMRECALDLKTIPDMKR